MLTKFHWGAPTQFATGSGWEKWTIYGCCLVVSSRRVPFFSLPLRLLLLLCSHALAGWTEEDILMPCRYYTNSCANIHVWRLYCCKHRAS